MKNKSRRDATDYILSHVSDYLEIAGWVLNNNFVWLDPITETPYSTWVAFQLQLERDFEIIGKRPVWPSELEND